MNLFASTRSETCSVGSIEDDGMRYGLTTHALSATTTRTATTIVAIQSMASRTPRGSRWKRVRLLARRGRTRRSMAIVSVSLACAVALGVTQYAAGGRPEVAAPKAASHDSRPIGIVGE